MRKKVTQEVTVCDFCGKETSFLDQSCAVCGKDLCRECDIAKDVTYRAYKVPICPEHKNLTLFAYIKYAKKQMERTGR